MKNFMVLNTNSYKGKNEHFKKKKGNQKNVKPKKDLSKIKCFRCENFEYYRSNCLENSKQATNCTNVTREEDNYDPENRVLYSSLSNEISSKAWVIDSGSFRHIMGYKETLDSLSEKANGEVTIGDNSAHSIEGIGNYTLKLKTRNTLIKC